MCFSPRPSGCARRGSPPRAPARHCGSAMMRSSSSFSAGIGIRAKPTMRRMSPEPIRAARGVRDVLPADLAAWSVVERAAHAVCRLFGYQQIVTPILEPVELIERAVGGETDIVEKELF